MSWDGEEGEDLLGVLLETDTAEFVGSNFSNDGPFGRLSDRLWDRGVFGEPVGGGEDGMGLIVGEEIANNLGALGHEETLATTELLLF